MTAGTREDLHELGAGVEEVAETGGGRGDFQALAKVVLLGGDADRAMVGVAGAHGDAADGLHGGVGYRDTVGTEGERFDEVGGGAQTAGGDQSHSAGGRSVEVAAGAGDGGNGREGNVSAEDGGGGAGAPAATVEDDVVGAGLEGEIDILFDVLSGEFEPDRNAAGDRSHMIPESGEIGRGREVGETGWRNGVGAGGKAMPVGDFVGDLGARQMSPGAGLGAWTAFEVEGLGAGDLVVGVAEFGAGKFVEVAGVGGLFFGEHAAFARADAGGEGVLAS